jgi:hyperosmotically inducible protein
MRNLKKLVLLSGMSAVMALTGCEMMNHHDGDRTAGRALDDKTITATVQHDLNREPVYKFDGIDVKTYDGVVQLSGFVDTEQQKHRAEEIAKQAEGVTQVVNNITLKPAGNTMAPTGQPNGYNTR